MAIGLTLLRAALLLPALAAACARDPAAGRWGSGSGPGFCNAAREGAEPLGITLGDSGASGISLYGPKLAGLTVGYEYTDMALFIGGEPVRARAFGATFAGRTGVDFAFNPRGHLRRHPDGMTLAVSRAGKLLYETRIGAEARQALAHLRQCERDRRRAARS